MRSSTSSPLSVRGTPIARHSPAYSLKTTKHPHRHLVRHPILHEVVNPDFVKPLGPQPNEDHIAKPKMPAHWRLPRHHEAALPPPVMEQLDHDQDAFPMKQSGAKVRVPKLGQLHPSGQGPERRASQQRREIRAHHKAKWCPELDFLASKGRIGKKEKGLA